MRAQVGGLSGVVLGVGSLMVLCAGALIVQCSKIHIDGSRSGACFGELNNAADLDDSR